MPHYMPPDFLDNTADRTLKDALNRLILDWDQRELDAATGFFEPHVWNHVCEAFPLLARLRLLLGRPPELVAQSDGALDLRRFFRRKLQQDVEDLPYNVDYAAMIDALLDFLRRESVEVRLYNEKFLHAKAYLFPSVAIVGSSNLTPSGLTGNSELNLVQKSDTVARALRAEWFERFWGLSEDYKAELVQTLEDSKFGATPYTPYQVFIKALYEFYRDRLGDEHPEARLGVDLALFQQEGLREAVRLLERHRGVLVADAVGLGKTYIGMGLMEHYLLSRRRGSIPRGIVVCPAQLRDLVWRPRLDEYGIKATVLSMEEMGRADFDWRAHNQVDFVLVDESHNFRNPNTGRYRNLMKLLATGKRDKRLVLMTATPINNTVWDLYHQVSLITRGEDVYYHDYGVRNLVSFFRAVDRGEAELFDLLEEVAVRRSRLDIRRRQEAGEVITLPGYGEIRFPERRLAAIEYDLTGTYDGFYAEVAAAVEALKLAAYNVEAYRKDKDEESREIEARNNALIGIMKTTFLKRLESSLTAFEISVRRAAAFQQRFFDVLVKEGRLLDSPSYRRILALESEGEADQDNVEAILGELEEVSIADYDLWAVRQALENDLTLFEAMLRRLDRIRAQDEARQDGKLAAVKARLAELLAGGDKVLLFTYYRDTADYLFASLQADADWRQAAGDPQFDVITGSTDPARRSEIVRRFAPRASAPDAATGVAATPLAGPELSLLISTDVLSEGQNLQDAGVLVNYDLHWNPVRMIQRAGRIDRLGSPHALLRILNVFPEQGLEELLHLVMRLQQRIRDIDRTVGLDASVLGEIVTERSLDELRRLRAGDRTVLDELERELELASSDEMRLPLVMALQAWGAEKVQDLPLGIHSGKSAPVKGFFLAFKAKDRHYWRFYPADGGDPITDRRQIFRWIQATPETDAVATSGREVFSVLEQATGDLFRELSQRRAARRVRPKLDRLNQQFLSALTQRTLFEESAHHTVSSARVRVVEALERVTLKPFRRDPGLKRLLQEFETRQDRRALAEALDAWLVDHELYREISQPTVLEQIGEEDLKLVCWEALS